MIPSNLNLDYYYGNEAEQYSFYRIPKVLMTEPRYRSISIDAKVLYGLLLDRMSLSVKNGWMDNDLCRILRTQNFLPCPKKII